MTSKYDRYDDDAHRAVRDSLRELGLTHLDLYLVHIPRVIKDLESLWEQMCEIREAGLSRYVCVYFLFYFIG